MFGSAAGVAVAGVRIATDDVAAYVFVWCIVKTIVARTVTAVMNRTNPALLQMIEVIREG